jgi:hypothetical protein
MGMAICVNNCLDVVDGILGVEVDPAGGITCGPDGLSASGIATAQAAADAAQADANTAQASADAAQADANTVLDRVPNKIRWGFDGGSPGVFGTFTFAHGLGGVPTAVVLTPYNTAADMNWHLAVENFDAVNVNVKVYKTDTTGFFTSSSFQFYWFAAL